MTGADAGAGNGQCHLSNHLRDGGDGGCDAFQILCALAGISGGFELAFESYGERDDAAASVRLHLTSKSQKPKVRFELHRSVPTLQFCRATCSSSR